MKQTWMIRAEGGSLIEMFLTKGITAIGWNGVENLKQFNDREAVIEELKGSYPSYSINTARIVAGVLWRFCNEIRTEDNVITYDPSKRIYHVGTILSDYCYDPKQSKEWPNLRKVKWNSQISRDNLSVNSKNILGSTLTLFSVPLHVFNEMTGESFVVESVNGTDIEAIEEENIFEDIQEKSLEFIKDKISKLDWDEMQKLVAGLLRAMGYKTKVSPKGSDLGKDIVASPDGFGLEQPRIVVEVKHRTQPMGSQEIRSFLGGRHKDDKGLYVSTGGFTKDAKYEADRASIPLTLMDIDDLVTESISIYEALMYNLK